MPDPPRFRQRLSSAGFLRVFFFFFLTVAILMCEGVLPLRVWLERQERILAGCRLNAIRFCAPRGPPAPPFHARRTAPSALRGAPPASRPGSSSLSLFWVWGPHPSRVADDGACCSRRLRLGLRICRAGGSPETTPAFSPTVPRLVQAGAAMAPPAPGESGRGWIWPLARVRQWPWGMGHERWCLTGDVGIPSEVRGLGSGDWAPCGHSRGLHPEPSQSVFSRETCV